MPAPFKTYIVLSFLPVVVEDNGDPVTYEHGAVFVATANSLSVIRLLETGKIAEVQTTSTGTGVVTIVGPPGPPGPEGPPAPPAGLAAVLSVDGETGAFNIEITPGSGITGTGVIPITAGAASDLSLGARGASTALNQSGQTSLHTDYTTAGRSSLIGALNALVDGTIPPDDLQTVLAVNPVTGTNNIVVTTGQRIEGAAELTLRANGANAIQFQTNGANTRWTIPQAGHLLVNGDGAVDIGASGASRPATVYATTAFRPGANVQLTVTGLLSGIALDVTAGPTHDLNLSARGTATAFNQSGQVALHNSFVTATRNSIIGAINALVDGSVGLPAGTLAGTLAAGNFSGGTDLVISNNDDLIIGSGGGPSNILWNGSGNIGSPTLSTRPDNVYVETSVVVGSTVTIGTASLAASGGLAVSSTNRLTVAAGAGQGIWIGATNDTPIQIGGGAAFPQFTFDINPDAMLVIEPRNTTAAGQWAGMFGPTAGTDVGGDLYLEGGYGAPTFGAGGAYLSGGYATGGPTAGPGEVHGGEGGITAAGGQALLAGGSSAHASLNAGDAIVRGGNSIAPARHGRVLIGDQDTRSITIGSAATIDVSASSSLWIGSAGLAAIQVGQGSGFLPTPGTGSVVLYPVTGVGAQTYLGLYGSDGAAGLAGGEVDIEAGLGFTGVPAGDVTITGGGQNGGTRNGYLLLGFDHTDRVSIGNATVFGGDNSAAQQVDIATGGRIWVGSSGASPLQIGPGNGTFGSGPSDILLEPRIGAGPGVGIYLQGAGALGGVAGGFVNIEAGLGTATGTPGSTFIYGGHANAFTGKAGELELHGGYGQGTGDGGDLDAAGGRVTNAAKLGGDAYLRGGENSAAAANHGRVFIGDMHTRSISIGAVGITTTFLGTVAGVALSSVLAAGNTTGANDISINTGRKLLGAAELTLEATGANNILFRTNSTERGRFGSAGTLYLGDGTAAAVIVAPFSGQALLAYRNERCYSSLYTFSATASDSGIMHFARGRGTAASPAIVVNGDTLGEVQFSAFDTATTGRVAAQILAVVDGTPGAADMPGRLVFRTTPDGTDVPVERMRITNDGVTIHGDGTLSATFAPPGASTPIMVYRNGFLIPVEARTFSATAGDGSVIHLRRHRGTAASPAAAANNDLIGGVRFALANVAAGTGNGASIEAFVDGTPGAGSAPGRIVLSTTADGSTTITERARLNNAGTMLFGNGTIVESTWTNSSYALYAYRTADSVLSVIHSFSNTANLGGHSLVARGRGTAASPAAVQNGDFIGRFAMMGVTDASNWGNAVQIIGEAEGNFTTGSIPSRMRLVVGTTGTATPVERLRINSLGTTFLGDGTLATAFLGAGDVQTPLTLYRSGGGSGFINMAFSATATDAPVMQFIRARGTPASPAIGQSGDILSRWLGAVATTTTAAGNAAEIRIVADGTVSNTASPGRIEFYSTPTGSLTPTERTRITSTGQTLMGTDIVGLSTITPAYVLMVGRNADARIQLSSSVGPPNFNFFHSNGTLASPTVSASGDSIGVTYFNGYTTAGHQNSAYIGAVAAATFAGTGTARAHLAFGTADAGGPNIVVERWRITNTGHFLAGADNAYDIGAVGANRLRNIYVGTGVYVGATNSFASNTWDFTFNSTTYNVDGLLYKDTASGLDVIAVGMEQGGGAAHLSFPDGGCLSWYDNTSIAAGDIGISFSSIGSTLLLDGGQFEFATPDYNTAGGLNKRLLITTDGNVVVGNAALATNATDGFLYIPSCAGAPNGTPTSYTGRVPLVYDSAGDELYVYSGGAWKSVALA